MAIKDILVLLDASSEVAGSYVLSVTAACEAHLTGAVLVVDPATIVPFAEMPSGFLAAALDEQRTAARQILERFASVAEEAGIAVDTEIHRPRSTLVGKPLARSPATLISRSSSSPIRMSSPSGRARSKQRCSPRAGLCLQRIAKEITSSGKSWEGFMPAETASSTCLSPRASGLSY